MHNTTYLSIHAAVILFELPDPREAVLIRCKEMEYQTKCFMVMQISVDLALGQSMIENLFPIFIRLYCPDVSRVNMASLNFDI